MYRSHRYDDCLKEVRKKLKQSSNSLHLLNYQAMAYSALKKDKESAAKAAEKAKESAAEAAAAAQGDMKVNQISVLIVVSQQIIQR